MRIAASRDERDRRSMRARLVIGTRRQQGIVKVDDPDDPPRDGNRLAAQAFRITGTIPPFVMRIDDVLGNGQRRIVTNTGGLLRVENHVSTVDGVSPHLGEFFGRQRSRLVQDARMKRTRC